MEPPFRDLSFEGCSVRQLHSASARHLLVCWGTFVPSPSIASPFSFLPSFSSSGVTSTSPQLGLLVQGDLERSCCASACLRAPEQGRGLVFFVLPSALVALLPPPNSSTCATQAWLRSLGVNVNQPGNPPPSSQPPSPPTDLAVSQLVPLSLGTPLKSFLLVSPSGFRRPLAPMELPSTKEEAEL